MRAVQAGTYGNKDRIFNAFVFGQQVEAFEYQPLGVHRTTSGELSRALGRPDSFHLYQVRTWGKPELAISGFVGLILNNLVNVLDLGVW